jgi:hypothetical protein
VKKKETLPYIDNENVGKMPPPYLSDILATMVDKNVAAYEPAKQTRAVLVYWRLPEEWAEVLYDWVREIDNPKKRVINIIARLGLLFWST